MKQEEINQMSLEDLQDNLISSQGELQKLAMSHKVSYLENPLQIRTLRRTIARLKTEINKRSNQA